MAKKTLNPEGMPVPRGSYSKVVISKPGRVVFIAGNQPNHSEIVPPESSVMSIRLSAGTWWIECGTRSCAAWPSCWAAIA